MYLPKKMVLTSGSGISNTALTSFDAALMDARIHDFNLVKVSSIAPKRASLVDKDFLKNLEKGTVLHCILSRYTAEKKETIASAVCLLITDTIGLITEYSGSCRKKYAREKVVKMAEIMCRERNLIKKDTYLTSIELDAVKNYSTVVSACVLV